MSIDYAFDSKPAHGEVTTIVDGLRWLRMPLPIILEHINLWLIRDEGGTAIVDTGLYTDASREIWNRTFTETLRGEAVSRVLVTHLHPDHAGCAGWLTGEHDVELWMSREEYLLCRLLIEDTGRDAPESGVRFYRAAGFSAEEVRRYRDNFGMFGRVVAPLPASYRRMVDGDTVAIGDGAWQVVVGRGHSPEHACLYDADRKLLIAGDQLLPTISSNVSVYPTEPQANPLKDWMDSLTALKDRVAEDVLVLPAHGRPFRGAHERIDALIDEHLTGLDRLLELCTEPRRAVDTFPALFKGRITQGNLVMATGEALAHLNYLLDTGDLVADARGETRWYSRS